MLYTEIGKSVVHPVTQVVLNAIRELSRYWRESWCSFKYTRIVDTVLRCARLQRSFEITMEFGHATGLCYNFLEFHLSLY